jgi:hypothetical protein
MHRVDNVLNLSIIPVVKIGTDMMCLPQKRSASTPVSIIINNIFTLAFHIANCYFYARPFVGLYCCCEQFFNVSH